MAKVERNEDRAVTIYALLDPDRGDVRYVGKTVEDPQRRLTYHLAFAKQGRSQIPSARWFRKCISRNVRPTIKVLEICSGSDWEAREIAWISEYRRRNMRRLLNVTIGGEGSHGATRSPEHRARIAAAQRTRIETACGQCGAAFLARPSAVAKGDAKYCSRECYGRSRRGIVNPSAHANLARARAAASAKRRKQTHCSKGHAINDATIVLDKRGNRRGCRICAKGYYWERKGARHNG